MSADDFPFVLGDPDDVDLMKDLSWFVMSWIVLEIAAQAMTVDEITLLLSIAVDAVMHRSAAELSGVGWPRWRMRAVLDSLLAKGLVETKDGLWRPSMLITPERTALLKQEDIL